MSYFEYYKMLLSKLSFDKALLEKEMQKAKNYMSCEEFLELERWVQESLVTAENLDLQNAASNTDYISVNTRGRQQKAY